MGDARAGPCACHCQRARAQCGRAAPSNRHPFSRRSAPPWCSRRHSGRVQQRWRRLGLEPAQPLDISSIQLASALPVPVLARVAAALQAPADQTAQRGSGRPGGACHPHHPLVVKPLYARASLATWRSVRAAGGGRGRGGAGKIVGSSVGSCCVPRVLYCCALATTNTGTMTNTMQLHGIKRLMRPAQLAGCVCVIVQQAPHCPVPRPLAACVVSSSTFHVHSLMSACNCKLAIGRSIQGSRVR